MGISFIQQDQEGVRASVQDETGEIVIHYSLPKLSELQRQFLGQDLDCPDMRTFNVNTSCYFSVRQHALMLGLLCLSDLSDKHTWVQNLLKHAFHDLKALGGFNDVRFVIRAIELTRSPYPYDFASSDVQGDGDVILASIKYQRTHRDTNSILRDIAKDKQLEDVDQLVESLLKRHYSELEPLGGLKDAEFVIRATELTGGRYPYDFSSQKVKDNEEVRLTVIEFAAQESDISDVVNTFTHQFKDAAWVLQVAPRNMALLMHAHHSLNHHKNFLLHAWVFGNWKPMITHRESHPLSTQFFDIKNYPCLLSKEEAGFLEDIERLQTGDNSNIRNKYFRALEDVYTMPVAEDEPQGIPFRMFGRALNYYKQSRTGPFNLFSGWTHYQGAVDEALNKLHKAEADKNNLYKTEPQQLTLVSGIVKDLCECSTRKGYKGKLSSVLIDLIIRLANYARDQIVELDVQQSQDGRAASASGAAVAAADDAVTEKDAWTAALSSLLDTQLTCREFTDLTAFSHSADALAGQHEESDEARLYLQA